MANLAQIYDWFMTGKKPTQAQFWASWGSFWNKEEQIPQSSISGLTSVLNAKTENDQFNAHKTDTTAHAALFDTKEDKAKKGVAGGYTPLNEIAQIASQYLNIVNDLVTGGATALASAETVKTLKTQIDGINTLLTSNDVNLDTVQELVNAIKTVQTSLSTILVNDLTTGGTTKAATAETVKVLKGLIDVLTTVVGNKVDKVAGERLINAGEITKLAGLGNIVTTIKPILSTALASQNVAGMVAYINALTPVLVVGGSEIVKYTTTDTGRVFQLNLRGRSFGVGQPAIVAADVLEVTEFLNKDIKLSSYPSTRNDGQLPTNKVLSTDANGNLKMYTIATAPAPYLEVLIPDSTLPSTTTNFVLKGAFFTPTMTVAIVGQTINYITFVSDNLVLVNVTTGATEGSYAVTLNNGIQAVFNNALLIVLGTVFTPLATDFTSVTQPVNLENGGVLLKTVGSYGSARLPYTFDFSKKFRVLQSFKASPLINVTQNGNLSDYVKITDLVTGTYWSMHLYTYPDNWSSMRLTKNGTWLATVGFNAGKDRDSYFYWDNVRMYIYYNGVLGHTYPAGEFPNPVKIEYFVYNWDIRNIKYIELAS